MTELRDMVREECIQASDERLLKYQMSEVPKSMAELAGSAYPVPLSDWSTELDDLSKELGAHAAAWQLVRKALHLLDRIPMNKRAEHPLQVDLQQFIIHCDASARSYKMADIAFLQHGAISRLPVRHWRYSGDATR